LAAALLISGCATTATVSEDGRTITMRTPPFTGAKAEFPSGHKIEKKSGGPKKLSIVNLDATMPLTANVDPSMVSQ